MITLEFIGRFAIDSGRFTIADPCYLEDGIREVGIGGQSLSVTDSTAGGDGYSPVYRVVLDGEYVGAFVDLRPDASWVLAYDDTRATELALDMLSDPNAYVSPIPSLRKGGGAS